MRKGPLQVPNVNPRAADAAPGNAAPALPSAGPGSPEDDVPPGEGRGDPLSALVEQQIRQNEALVASSRSSVSWSGYIDFGLFVPQGNGAGYVQDFGHQRLNRAPYTSYNWVFLGDILAPAVNTRGEAADLGDAPGVSRFDSINSRGAPGFAINEVNLRLAAGRRRTPFSRPASTWRRERETSLRWGTSSTSISPSSSGCPPIRSAHRSSWARWTRFWGSSTGIANRIVVLASPPR